MSGRADRPKEPPTDLFELVRSATFVLNYVENTLIAGEEVYGGRDSIRVGEYLRGLENTAWILRSIVRSTEDLIELKRRGVCD